MQEIKSNDAPAPIGPYSQAILAGNTLYISGQIPLDPWTEEIVASNITDETHQVMSNIQRILEAADMGFSNVVKCSIFITSMGDFQEINAVYSEYLTEPYPARETVEVSKLPKGVHIEISCIAVKSE